MRRVASSAGEPEDATGLLAEEYDEWGRRYKAAQAAAEAAGRPSYDDPTCNSILGRNGPWDAMGKRLRAHPAAKLLGQEASGFGGLAGQAKTLRNAVGKWNVAGWTSRLDLAQKLAAQQQSGKYGGGPLRDVRILEARKGTA